MPFLGLSWVMPKRSDELPYEYTSAPVAEAPPTPVGPPKPGTEGLTLPTSAGSIFTSARSLYAQVSAFDSPLACIVSHELYASVPGREAPVTSTEVPSGSEPARQPSVSVAAPVLAQWAACPM